MPDAHAKLSPSSAYRWFVCPGSIRATAGMPDDSNEYAREGTAAHALGEECMRNGMDAADLIGLSFGVDYTDAAGQPQTQHFVVNHDMADAVQVYVDTCRTFADYPEAVLLLEQEVGLGSIAPELAPVWGTADCIVYVPRTRTLYAIDYKHGRGKVVDVADNKQLKIYALAAWATFATQFKVDFVVTVVVQPRAGGEPVREATYTAAELIDFAQDCVEAVQRTEAPDAPLVPGDHCDFCKAKATCRALADNALVVAKDEFAMVPPERLTIEQCVALLAKAELLEDWLKAIRERLHNEALAGRPVPGYKLVPRRATRQWAVSENQVVAALAPLVADDAELFSKELLSPAQMERVVGKKNLPKDLIASVSSGYNLVKDTDSRPGITLHPGDDFASLPAP